MNGSLKPLDFYLQTIRDIELNLKPLRFKRKLLGWTRLLSILASLSLIWYAITSGTVLVILPAMAVFGLFLLALSTDLDNDKKIQNLETLTELAREEIRTLDHDFSFRKEGIEFLNPTHPYAHDLDILGHASIFQFLNRCESEPGQVIFSQWLLLPASTVEIRERHTALTELAGKPDWLAQFQAHGRLHPVSLKTQAAVTRWIAEPLKFSTHGFYKIVRWVLPLLSLSNLLAYSLGWINGSQFYPFLFLFFILSLLFSRQVMPAYVQLNKINEQLATLSYCTGHLEQLVPTSPFLSHQLNRLKHGQEKASGILKKLQKIMDRLDYRLNPLVFLPLNTFLFWDLQQVLSLEKWKSVYKENVLDWFRVYGEMEALASLARIKVNHPQWVLPVILDKDRVYQAEELGHPLIPHPKRVNSSISITGEAQIALVTGSNMAGKSTFLRSVGINTVLAMAGAPVCATRFALSPWKVMSSMRISDNLEESTSTFYAELKKLKAIIEEVNKKENILILLDEILRGTNSADRHTGSAALIRQLIRHQATGLVATHDLELAALAKEFPAKISNYHFDVQVEGEELHFDYKLKEGVCRSMNASLLMKKIGIEI